MRGLRYPTTVACTVIMAVWSRLKVRKLNDFASCFAQNCTVSAPSWKNPSASLVGSALNFQIQVGLLGICWTGSK
jgi:hypothetical protein